MLILGTVAACYFIKPASMVTEAGVVMKWPDQVLGFAGKDEPVNESERKLLPPDTEFAKKIYTDSSGNHVSVETVPS